MFLISALYYVTSRELVEKPKTNTGRPHPVAKCYFGWVLPKLQEQRYVTSDWKCYKVITVTVCVNRRLEGHVSKYVGAGRLVLWEK